MNERPLFFANRHSQRLFGVLCATQNAPVHRIGAVLCAPLGEDFVMGYRAYTVWARALAQAGIPSLRFHYAGCGNSEADALDVRLAGLVGDTCDACEFLRHETGCEAILLAGARLGASVATLAASGRADVAALSLHSPVVAGAEYWTTVLRGQQIADMARGKRADAAQPQADDNGGYIEVFADRWANAFIEDLRALDLLEARPPPVRRAQLAALASDRKQVGANEALMQRWRDAGIDVTAWHEDARAFWVPRAMQEGYVPGVFIERAVAWASAA